MIVDLLKSKFNIDYSYGIETNNVSIVLTKQPIFEVFYNKNMHTENSLKKRLISTPFFKLPDVPSRNHTSLRIREKVVGRKN